jgi:hypothetical protein
MPQEFHGREYHKKMHGSTEAAREFARSIITKDEPNQKALDYFRSKPFYFQQKERMEKE